MNVLFAPGADPSQHYEQARMRRVPEERRHVGTPAPLHGMRPCGLLRFLEEQARHQALSPHASIPWCARWSPARVGSGATWTRTSSEMWTPSARGGPSPESRGPRAGFRRRAPGAESIRRACSDRRPEAIRESSSPAVNRNPAGGRRARRRSLPEFRLSWRCAKARLPVAVRWVRRCRWRARVRRTPPQSGPGEYVGRQGCCRHPHTREKCGWLFRVLQRPSPSGRTRRTVARRPAPETPFARADGATA